MIKFRGKRVGVEKLSKKTKKDTSLYVEVESEEFIGIIKYVSSDSSSDLKVGDKVYFGTNFQNARIGGANICVMDDTNVYATVNEEKTEQNAQA